jgi:suppressor of fused-like protein
MTAGQGSGVDWSTLVAYLDRVAGGPPIEVFSPRRGGALDMVRIYALADPAHWHVVTLGLSDLNFELTVRLSRPDDTVPLWAVDLMVSLARYARGSGHPFAAGHHIDLRGPIKLDSDTAITAAALTIDPTLGPVAGVEFLQLIGLTADDLELCRSWHTSAVVDLLRRRDPFLVTELDRQSLLDDPARREEAAAGVAADGSSLNELRVATLEYAWHGRRHRRMDITVGAGAATALGPALRRKLNQEGASFRVVGDEGDVCFSVAGKPSWRLVGTEVMVQVPLADVDQLAGLFTGAAGAGSLPAWPDLRFVVTG